MVVRKTRHPRRYEEDNSGSEIRRETRETGMVTRRLRETQIRTENMKSQTTPVQTNPRERGWDENHSDRLYRSKRRESRLSTAAKANSELSSGVRAILETNGRNTPAPNRRTSTEQTPLRSINGSESSATQRKHKINTRSKGSVHTSSSDSSSDQEEISMESLSELNESLRLAQTRATTLSTNFARLMRLVVDDELDVLDRQIAQVRNGSHDTLKTKYKEALAECERKRSIARFRLVAAETEIDIRYQAMAEAEWQQFNNDKLMAREEMCENISSQITRLQRENDEARSLNLGVRPDSSLQQAPWWVKIPKQIALFNLPLGVNEDQRDKDLARMGIPIQRDIPQQNERKRKRKHGDNEMRQRRESYPPQYADEADYSQPAHEEYPTNSQMSPWPTGPSNSGDFHSESRANGPLNSLIRTMEDDVRRNTLMPTWLSLPDPSMPFKHNCLPSVSALESYTPPTLLPRPSMMPPATLDSETIIPAHETEAVRRLSLEARHPGLTMLATESAGTYLPPTEVRELPPPRRMSTILNTAIDREEPRHRSNERRVSMEQPPETMRQPIIELPPLIQPTEQRRPMEPASNYTPKPIAPRPAGLLPPIQPPLIDPPKPLPIKPSPAPKSRSSSTSPDLQRTKRPPQSLLPKTRIPSPPTDAKPPTPTTDQDPRPLKERNPLARHPKTPVTGDTVRPPPAPTMGRFANAVHMDTNFSGNKKIAISRLPNQAYEAATPLRIAPAPVKKVGEPGISMFVREEKGSGLERGERGSLNPGKMFVEIRRKSSGDEGRINGNGGKGDGGAVDNDKRASERKENENEGESGKDSEEATKLKRGLRSTSRKKD